MPPATNADALPDQRQIALGKCRLDVPPDGFDVQALQHTDATKQYLDQKQKYFNYQRKRKKLRKERIKRTRSLLLLLDKLNVQLDELEEHLPEGFSMPAKYDQRRKVVRKVTGSNLQCSTPAKVYLTVLSAFPNPISVLLSGAKK